MYREDDFPARRERINDSLLRQILGENDESIGNVDSGCEREHAMRDSRNQASDCRQMNRRTEETNKSRKNWGLVDYPLASVYAPLQVWRDLYDNEKALLRGTIFEELDLPFLGSGNSDSSGSGCNSCEGGCRRGCGGEKNG